jgi:hypothetical protein
VDPKRVSSSSGALGCRALHNDTARIKTSIDSTTRPIVAGVHRDGAGTREAGAGLEATGIGGGDGGLGGSGAVGNSVSSTGIGSGSRGLSVLSCQFSVNGYESRSVSAGLEGLIGQLITHN